MKFALTSDTHYGHSAKTHKIHDKFWAEVAALDCPVIWAGDLGSNRLDQFERTLLMARRYITQPIYAVRGNHDFWQESRHKYGYKSWNLLMEAHAEAFRAAGVHHLQDAPITLQDGERRIRLLGFDGWYASMDPGTNDSIHMPYDVEGCPIHVYLANIAHKKLDEILADTEECDARIVVTHFPPFTNSIDYLKYCANLHFMAPICEFADVLCVGHSHAFENSERDKCRILNCGSSYDTPQVLVFEV